MKVGVKKSSLASSPETTVTDIVEESLGCLARVAVHGRVTELGI